MLIGENRALQVFSGSINKYATASTKPCIFLSHISLDKTIVLEIGNYLMKAGVDIYMDLNDTRLQTAVKNESHKEITSCIENGIEKSSDILCLLSNNTINSWWVPYELGYGKKCNKHLVTMPIKSVSLQLPSYIKISTHINGVKELNNYIQSIMKRYTTEIVTKYASYQNSSYLGSKQAGIIEESTIYHPLKSILNQ